MAPRDPNKPRGRVSAYAFYQQHCREQWKKKHPNESMAIAEFNKKCGDNWKALSDKQKQPFQEMAKHDKVRFDEEMANYLHNGNTNEGRGKKPKRAKDPNAPKRPLSAFFWFSQYERPKVKEAMPNATVGEIAKELGRRWGTFTDAKKAPYESMAANDRARYEEEMNAYKSNED